MPIYLAITWMCIILVHYLPTMGTHALDVLGVVRADGDAVDEGVEGRVDGLELRLDLGVLAQEILENRVQALQLAQLCL